MARFRAYITDSDEEDEVLVKTPAKPVVPAREIQEDEELAADSRSSSDSEMLEAELLISPVKHKQYLKKGLVQGKVGEYYDKRAERPEIPTDVSSSESESEEEHEPSPQLISRNPIDPSIIPWARHVGVEPQKMHVMQTSLFRMPEEAAALENATQPRRLLSHLTNINIPRKHSRDSDGEGLRLDLQQRQSFGHDIEPLPYRPSRKYARVEQSQSVVGGCENVLVDSGLALGRSFRVGWGPRGTLVHLGVLCGPSNETTLSANSSIIQVSKIPVYSSKDTEESDRASKLLSHHLSNSSIDPDADGVPFANPSINLSFSSFIPLFSPTDVSFEASLFRLGHALLDDIDLRLADTISVDVRNRIYTLRRKDALSSWLQEVVATTVETELRDSLSSDPAASVFTLLTGNQIENAVEAASESGNVKMATLLSQSGGDYDFRDDVLLQLQLWNEQRIYAHMSEYTRKIYALLAGVVDRLEGSDTGSKIEHSPVLHMAQDLDWKRAFGLHLWYGEALDCGIGDSFQSYIRSWQESPSTVAPPSPWYRESLPSKEYKWKMPSAANTPDTLYSLIKLFVEPAYSLSNVLSPFSFGPSPVDYRLCWHLYIIVSRCLRIRDFADRGDPGPRIDPDDNEDHRVEGHSPSADLLTNSYAFQLEQLNMIQEAVFVLLHIEASAGRKTVIKNLLARSAPQLDDWTIRGLVGSLKIPLAWVNEAKATYALSRGMLFQAYELYISAGLWNTAHDLAIFELAPDAVIRQDFDLLKSLFNRMATHSVNTWHVRGKAFLDYAHAMIRLPELKEHIEEEGILDASESLELEEFARSIPKLIGILPDLLRERTDERHNVALAEMIAGLTACLDKVKPLALAPSQIRTALVKESTRLDHIQSTSYERFLRTIEVA